MTKPVEPTRTSMISTLKYVRRIISKNGVDKELFQKHMKEHGNIDGAILLPEDWDFYQQYAGGFQDLYGYVVFCQHLDVRIHEELMELHTRNIVNFFAAVF